MSFYVSLAEGCSLGWLFPAPRDLASKGTKRIPGVAIDALGPSKQGEFLRGGLLPWLRLAHADRYAGRCFLMVDD